MIFGIAKNGTGFLKAAKVEEIFNNGYQLYLQADEI